MQTSTPFTRLGTSSLTSTALHHPGRTGHGPTPITLGAASAD